MNAKLTPAQQEALGKINAEGVLYPYNGVSVATVDALEAKGLVTVTHLPPSHQYGSLGPTSGARGYYVREWIARPIGFEAFAQDYKDADLATKAWREQAERKHMARAANALARCYGLGGGSAG